MLNEDQKKVLTAFQHMIQQQANLNPYNEDLQKELKNRLANKYITNNRKLQKDEAISLDRISKQRQINPVIPKKLQSEQI